MHTIDKHSGASGREPRRAGPGVTRTVRSRITKRLLVAGGVLTAALIAAPTALGLASDSSLSRDLPVPVPSRTHLAHFGEPQPDSSRARTADDSVRYRMSRDTVDDHGRLGDDDGGVSRSRDDRWSGGQSHDDHGGRTAGHGSDDPPGDR